MKRLAAGIFFVALLTAPAIAGDPLPWGGVGWYIKAQGSYQGAQPFALSGPFSGKEICDSEIARRRNADPASTMSVWCSYETVAWASPSYDDYEDY